jgi:peptidoglycan hydrolase CwlO-like protein
MMNEDECKTVEIAPPLHSFLEDQKKIRNMNSISAVISRIISEKRNIEVKVSMLEDEVKELEAKIAELESELKERTRLEGSQV